MKLKIRNYIEPSGQRNAVIVDATTGLPEFWPTLYASTQLRSRGASQSTLNAQLGAIICLYRWAHLRGLNLEERILSQEGFSRGEIDSLVTLLRSRLSDLPVPKAQSKVVSLDRKKPQSSDIWQILQERTRQINASTFNDRLDYVGRYMIWLCDYLSDQTLPTHQHNKRMFADIGEHFKLSLSAMKSVEPNTAFAKSRDLNSNDIRSILEAANPQNFLNPWESGAARIRNFAIICVLLDTGLRSGELLSLKIQDIIFAKKGAKGLKVRRRQGSKDDPRVRQPSTKRGEREVPLSEGAFQALDAYVSAVRNQIPGVSQTEYLFLSVGNKSHGRPMSSITPITDKLRSVTGIDLTPHRLRHTATWRYCISQKRQGREWDEFVEALILKFGWNSPDSPMVRHYAKRFIKEQMFESAIREQDEINHVMKAASDAARK